MGFNNYKNSKNYRLNDLFAKLNEISKKAGLAKMTTPSPKILLDGTGKEYLRRQKMYFTRAGVESGRYLREKNETFRTNYMRALAKLPNQQIWRPLIQRILKLDISENLWDVLPPLKDWYPQKKLFKGSDLPSVASYKGETDIDLLQDALKADLEESLNLLGV